MVAVSLISDLRLGRVHCVNLLENETKGERWKMEGKVKEN